MGNRTRLAPSKTQARSAITNGKHLLAGIDGRSHTARRYRDLFRAYLTETGGRHEELCKQAASLVLQRELLDAAQVRGEHVDTLHLVRLCGVINRTLARLKHANRDPDKDRKRREHEDREAGLR